MTIQYKVLQLPQPGVSGGGDRKWHARIHYNGEATIDDLVEKIVRSSTLSSADIYAVIHALQDAIKDELAESRIVRLNVLGSLYPTLSSGGTSEKADFNASQIRKLSVNYKPGKEIVKRIKEAGVKKVR